ncbi:GntR family transcriptional regulator [Ruania alba]|uniref:DNA-binding transcriptional regulator, GntR family n=1 Tax=Ruania alba TaxID=648782 RepID=A0A1H5GTZ1_9MICO|nr:GntR family transcriptional regulator [Ruania alba]SEE18984.1 DNA-binding transcriptional regulator, GntR family [Ruania alba]
MPAPEQTPTGEPAPAAGTIDQSQSDRLCRELRNRIITGVYPQGSRLPEHRLAADLDVSRIPLREVLPRIEAEGLITTLPRRSAVVATWTLEGVHHLFEARLAIEVAAASYAARSTADGVSLENLEDALRSSEIQMRRRDELGFAQANASFHAALVEASRNPLMTKLMGSLTSRMTWLFLLTSQRDHQTACREHHELIEAISSGNERLAEAATYAHIEAGRAPTIEAMRTLVPH